MSERKTKPPPPKKFTPEEEAFIAKAMQGVQIGDQIDSILQVCSKGSADLKKLFSKPLDPSRVANIKIVHARLDNATDAFDKLFTLCRKWLKEDRVEELLDRRMEVNVDVRVTKKLLLEWTAREMVTSMKECTELRKEVGEVGEFGLLGWELLHLHGPGIYDTSVGTKLDRKEIKKTKQVEKMKIDIEAELRRKEKEKEKALIEKGKKFAEDMKGSGPVVSDPDAAVAYIKNTLAEVPEGEDDLYSAD